MVADETTPAQAQAPAARPSFRLKANSSDGTFVLVDEDVYDATFVRWEEIDLFSKFTGQTEPRLKLYFRLADPDGQFDGQEQNALCTPSLNIKATLRGYIAALGLDISDGDDFDGPELLDSLVGRPCRVNIKQKKSANGMTFSNVVDVLPPARRNRQPAAAPASPTQPAPEQAQQTANRQRVVI